MADRALNRHYLCIHRSTGRVATVSVTCPNPDEGATGPSRLGTGDGSKNTNKALRRGRITAYPEVDMV
jgi:hypothetical protein